MDLIIAIGSRQKEMSSFSVCPKVRPGISLLDFQGEEIGKVLPDKDRDDWEISKDVYGLLVPHGVLANIMVTWEDRRGKWGGVERAHTMMLDIKVGKQRLDSDYLGHVKNESITIFRENSSVYHETNIRGLNLTDQVMPPIAIWTFYQLCY